MKLNLFSSVAALAIAAVAPSIANAAVIISNTGIDNSWVVGSSGATVTATRVNDASVQSSIKNSATSAWISTSANEIALPGYYTYSTNVSAAAGDVFTFRFLVDDTVQSILLNGVAVPTFNPVVSGGTYDSWTTVTIAGFQAGNNSLAFNTVNQDVRGNVANAAGFRLESLVPEPASWGMMVLGFGAIGGAMRTSRRKVTFA